MNVRVYSSPSAAQRLSLARDLLRACAPGARVLIIGASRGAADDLARDVAASVPATFGIQRFSLTQFAAKTAILALAADRVTPSTRLGAEAVATRALFDAGRDQSLRYFEPVAATPGFPRALARTLQELRLAGIDQAGLTRLPLAGADLANLLERCDACFERAGAVDRADLFRTAARTLRTPPIPPIPDFVLLLDVPLEQAAERELADAVLATAGAACVTVPHGDQQTLAWLTSKGAVVENRGAAGANDLARLHQFLFNADEQPPERTLDGSLEFLSAPGEGRECVEIARRILKEARAGVRFDEMAILVRSPHSYFGLLEHALRRADVPAWFDRGTRRPHPAGRAFLALLACAAEQLSASRFAEYLSLGQVPGSGTRDRGSEIQSTADFLGSPNPDPRSPSLDEAFGRTEEIPDDELEEEARESAAEPVNGDEPSLAGTLRAPWRWERLLVEAAVIGQSADRWKRRLDGKKRELQAQIKEATRQDGDDSPRVLGLQQVAEQLDHLEAFALPLIRDLAAWPDRATWGEWLDRFEALAPRVLRVPAQVLRVLADLRPMSEVGPIDLDEARRVLSERLLMLESEPPSRRFGRVFVSTPQQARGRSFRVVFVPGLAERMFPQKPREDPLLLDTLRADLDAGLPTQGQRLVAERLLLQLAAGAASERLYVSYPRIELAESRARVPSFYALDVMRAATGRVPHQEDLEAQARTVGSATLAWPAPVNPAEAIDDQEHDLSVLRALLDNPDRDAVKGHAHYLLKLNECLRRSVIDRWARSESRWSVNDGLTRVSPDTRAMLASQRLTARPYSLSALQRFSACPYQFVLAAMYRLQPLEQPEPLEHIDPLTRGSIFHDIQARFFRLLQTRGLLPVTVANLDQARLVLEEVADATATQFRDELAPAVDRVWIDEIASIRRDLHGWLHHLAQDGEDWTPKYFEFAFGSVPGERDEHSLRDAVTLEGGYRLRGAIDLIEEHRPTRVVRVTDHKTGRKPERIERVIVGGGAVLQPVLYAMAVEAALGAVVSHGRLFYCTSAGGYYEHPIPLSDTTRTAAREVLQVIDRAIETGFLAAAPAEEACSRCDYRPVCGPDVFRRVGRKPKDALADLLALRSRI
jgi:CRISPR/Cas system-associated exonuclease Cas4 (RecB family)